MSKKFNLKTYQKISGDQHIDSRLKEDHETAPNEVNEKQLDDYRVNKEPEILIEKQLEENRKSSKIKEATEVTEKQLDTAKEKFDVKLRNASAYEGDLPKLEEQRLKGDPIENEKYEDASQTPAKMRWWEQGGKSPDGLKIAQKKSVALKTAQFSKGLDFTKPRFEDTLEEGVSPFELSDTEAVEEAAINPTESVKEEYEIDDFAEVDSLPDFDIDEDEPINKPILHVVKEKDLTDVPALYMVLEFVSEDFGGDELDIKQAALDKVLDDRPELKGLISVSDFVNVQDNGTTGVVTLNSSNPRLKYVFEAKEADIGLSDGIFEEISYDVDDMGGTSMASGRVAVDVDVVDENREKVIEDALAYIQTQYGIDIDEDVLDLSNLESGEIAFLTEVPRELAIASTSFPILEVNSQSVKKK